MIRKFLPLSLRLVARCWKVLEIDHGRLRSIWRRECVGREGEPLPWYTYPAVEQIRQRDLRDRTVFEFGCGNSTLFWASLASRVIAVEDDELWAGAIQLRLPPNGQVHYTNDAAEYVGYLFRISALADVIIVDGANRLACAIEAARHLKRGGLVILDNSDWYPAAAAERRKTGLLQVDMSGFGPINHYTWTTSFFFQRSFDFQPRLARQPTPAIGSIPDDR